jgi:soluble lytic murein transglycosylase-like protein
MKNKKYIVISVLLFLIIVLSLFLSVKFYINNRKLIAENRKLQKSLFIANKKLIQTQNKMQFIDFKINSFDRRFPEYSRIVDTVYTKSKRYGFNPNLILALIKVESSFNPRAISSVGAYGLMQINYSVWKNTLNIDPDKIFNIDYNIEMGLKILKKYYDESHGDIKKALFLYNNGYFYKNKSYVTKVVRAYSVYGREVKSNSKGI